MSALLTLKSSLFLNSKEFSESFTFCHCCSIFKELRAPSEVQLCYYIKTFSLCQHFFKSFFKVFFEAFWAFRPCSCRCSSYFVYSVLFASALADDLHIISTHSPFVNYFFHLFSPSPFLTIYTIHQSSLCAIWQS